MRPGLQSLGKPALFAPLGRKTAPSGGGPRLETLVRRAAPLVAVPDDPSSGAARRGNASLSGYVYADLEWLGERSSNDCPLAGVAVTLIGADVNGEAVNLTTTTDENGFYQFVRLPAGTYWLSRETPALFYFDAASNVGSLGGMVDTDGSISQIALKASDNGINYNFGEVLIPGS